MKVTRYCKIDSNNLSADCLKKAASVLRWGGIVAFPTETVYGLGANAFNAGAVAKVFAAKGRPADNPLIVHIAREEELPGLVREIPPEAYLLMEHFWPGPLTLILPRTEAVPDIVTAGLDTVGIRMPDHPLALALLEKARVPVAAPSANLSGKPSPTTGLDVLRDLVGKVDFVIDGGKAKVGVESTVLDLTVSPPMILRPGGICKEQLEAVLGEVRLDPALAPQVEDCVAKPRSPGMKYTHYAPRAQVTVVMGSSGSEKNRLFDRLVRDARCKGLRVGLLLTEETARSYGGNMAKPHYLEVLGSQHCLETIANRLFGALRRCDRQHLDVVFAEGVHQEGLGLAIMNRLTKAAGHRVLWV